MQKFVLLMGFCVALTWAGPNPSEFVAEFQRASSKCSKDAGISDEEVEAFLKKRPLETDDGRLKCLLKCILLETKWIDEQGNIQMKAEGEVPAHLMKIVESCKSSAEGTDACDKAYNFHKCIIENKPGH